MTKIEKVLIYWEGNDNPFIMNREQFVLQEQAMYNEGWINLIKRNPEQFKDFKKVFAERWERGEFHES